MSISEKTKINIGIAVLISILISVIAATSYTVSKYLNMDYRVFSLEQYKTSEEKLRDKVWSFMEYQNNATIRSEERDRYLIESVDEIKKKLQIR